MDDDAYDGVQDRQANSEDIKSLAQAIESAPGTTVDLTDRQLGELSSEIIQRLASKRLERLALGQNDLTALPLSFSSLTRLRYLNIRKNHLSAFPHALLSMPQLEILDLSRNKLSSLPLHALPLSLPNLKVIALSKNRIKVLPPSISQLEKLRFLLTDGNPLEWPPVERGVFSGDVKSPGEMQSWVEDVKQWMATRYQDGVHCWEKEKKRSDAKVLPPLTAPHTHDPRLDPSLRTPIHSTRKDTSPVKMRRPLTRSASVPDPTEAESENEIHYNKQILSRPLKSPLRPALASVSESNISPLETDSPTSGRLLDDVLMQGKASPADTTSASGNHGKDQEKYSHSRGSSLSAIKERKAPSPAVSNSHLLYKSHADPSQHPTYPSTPILSKKSMPDLRGGRTKTTMLPPLLEDITTSQVNVQLSPSRQTISPSVDPANRQVVGSAAQHQRNMSLDQSGRQQGKNEQDPDQDTEMDLEVDLSSDAERKGIGIRMAPDRRSGAYFRRVSGYMHPHKAASKDTSVVNVPNTFPAPPVDTSAEIQSPRKDDTMQMARLLSIVEAARGTLFLLSQMYTAVRQYAQFAPSSAASLQISPEMAIGAEKSENILSRVLRNASTHLGFFVDALDRLDQSDNRARTHREVVKDVIQSAKRSIATFRKVLGVLILQVVQMTAIADIRYSRWLCQSLSGVGAEIGETWVALIKALETSWGDYEAKEKATSTSLARETSSPHSLCASRPTLLAGDTPDSVSLPQSVRKQIGATTFSRPGLTTAQSTPVMTFPEKHNRKENASGKTHPYTNGLSSDDKNRALEPQTSSLQSVKLAPIPELSQMSSISSAHVARRPSDSDMLPINQISPTSQLALAEPGRSMPQPSAAMIPAKAHVTENSEIIANSEYTGTKANVTQNSPTDSGVRAYDSRSSLVESDNDLFEIVQNATLVSSAVLRLLMQALVPANADSHIRDIRPDASNAEASIKEKDLIKLTMLGNSVTSKLQGDLDLMRKCQVELQYNVDEQRMFWDDMNGFVQVVIQLSTLARQVALQRDFAKPLLQGLGQLTRATKEMTILMSVSSFRKP